MEPQKVAMIAVLAALSIGTNYAMIFLFNVKLMDFIVFVGGFCFGPFVGASIGIVSWAVYGTLNPMGFSLPIWLSTMFMETIYGVVGGLMRRRLNLTTVVESRDGRINAFIFFAAIGMLLTFVYDIVTNIVFGYVIGWNILFAVIIGFVPFGLVHSLSNALFFGIGCVPAINAILNVAGGENFGISEK